MCAKCVSLCLHIFLILFLGLCFCLLYPIPIYCFTSTLFYYYPLTTCLFSPGRQKGSGSIWEERWGGNGGVNGDETLIRMYCMKIIYIQ